MQIVPLSAVPSQTTAIVLSSQNCRINIYQKSTGVFFDLYVDDEPVCLAVMCLDRNLLVRDAYLGFSGDFSFVDVQGTNDPDYTGFGSRYLLNYYTADDLA